MNAQHDRLRKAAEALEQEVGDVLSSHPTAGTYPDGPCLEKHSRIDLQSALAELDAALAAPKEAGDGWLEDHDDERVNNRGVDLFAEAMKAKLETKRLEGYTGWNNCCTVEHLAKLLLSHVPKGDPVDIANFAMMLFHRNGADAIRRLAAPSKEAGAGDLPFDVVRQVVRALTRLGFATPCSQEEQAARGVELVRDLCSEVQSHFDSIGAVPGVWKLVPIEPTWDMRNEGREFLIDGIEKEPEKLAYFLWKTMIAASPEST